MFNTYEEMKEMFDYSLENGLISLDVLKYLTKEELEKMELIKYIKGIEFNYDTDLAFVKDKILYFGVKTLSSHLPVNNLTIESAIRVYKYLLSEIYSELQRLHQSRIVHYYKKYKNLFTESEKLTIENYALILKSEKEYFNIDTIYSKYFDYLPSEHESNYIGFYKAILKLQELTPLYDEFYNEEYTNKEIVDNLTKDYVLKGSKVISPYERLPLYGLDYLLRRKISRINSFNNYKKLMLGMPVEKSVVLNLRNDMKLRNGKFYKHVRFI